MFGEVIDLRWEDCDAVARDGHVIALESPKPINLSSTYTDITCTFCSFVPYDTLSAGHSVSDAIKLTQFQVVLRFQLKVNPLPFALRNRMAKTDGLLLRVSRVHFVSCRPPKDFL